MLKFSRARISCKINTTFDIKSGYRCDLPGLNTMNVIQERKILFFGTTFM